MKDHGNNEFGIFDERFRSQEFERYLRDLVNDARFNANWGMVADYVAELRMAVESKCGIALHLPDNTVIAAGDHNKFSRSSNGSVEEERRNDDDSFTIQSISKVFALLYVLEESEIDVFKKIGKEPTGDPPNVFAASFMRVRAYLYNPMINAGAIFITSLFPGKNRDSKFTRFFEFVKKMCCDNNMIVDKAVCRSEKAVGHQSRALAWQMIAKGILVSEKAGEEALIVEDVLDNYFRQCSILANCDHLARAACVLATGGVDPATGKRIAEKDHVCSVISLMATCGLYDASGEFAYKVGLPGQSSVGGGIIAVVPGRCGVATFSPAVDDRGNSVRGIYMLKQMTEKYRLNIFCRPPTRCKLEYYGTSEAVQALEHEIRINVSPPKFSEIANHIPQPSKTDPLRVGISICFNDGQMISEGDHDVRFSMQGISKVFGLLYVLNKRGEDEVFRHVSTEPSGSPFNVLKLTTRRTEKGSKIVPFNPLINAGAIVIASMIAEQHGNEARAEGGFLKIDDFITFVRRLCGDFNISINYSVFESERRRGYNNRSLAWRMNDYGVFDDILTNIDVIDNTKIEDILSVYFRLCSIEVTCDNLARFAAVLANNGRDLYTEETMIPPRNVAIASSMMTLNGLYDESGEFASDVGIPAKSGLSGGILSVVPGKIGIATYSATINDKGNSYIAIKLLEEISKKERLSIFRGGW